MMQSRRTVVRSSCSEGGFWGFVCSSNLRCFHVCPIVHADVVLKPQQGRLDWLLGNVCSDFCGVDVVDCFDRVAVEIENGGVEDLTVVASIRRTARCRSTSFQSSSVKASDG